MASEAQRLRELAERYLRLSREALPDDVARHMRTLAAEYLAKAQALERAADRQQQQVGNVVPLPPPPEPSHGAAQQQQQAQPKKADDSE
jgi:hypothetical protein